MIREADFISPRYSKHKSIFITMETLETFDMSFSQQLKQGRAKVEELKAKIQLIRRLQRTKERQSDKDQTKELIRHMVDMKVRLLTKREQIRSRVRLLKQNKADKQKELLELAKQLDAKSKVLSKLTKKRGKKQRSKSMMVRSNKQPNNPK